MCRYGFPMAQNDWANEQIQNMEGQLRAFFVQRFDKQNIANYQYRTIKVEDNGGWANMAFQWLKITIQGVDSEYGGTIAHICILVC